MANKTINNGLQPHGKAPILVNNTIQFFARICIKTKTSEVPPYSRYGERFCYCYLKLKWPPWSQQLRTSNLLQLRKWVIFRLLVLVIKSLLAYFFVVSCSVKSFSLISPEPQKSFIGQFIKRWKWYLCHINDQHLPWLDWTRGWRRTVLSPVGSIS